MNNTRSSKINQVQYSEKILSSHAGLLPYSTFLETSGFIDTIHDVLKFSKGSRKGESVESIIKQILCFMADGRSKAISYFDHLGHDPGYAAALELEDTQLISSSVVKRIVAAIAKTISDNDNNFRNILTALFRNQLRQSKPKSLVIGIDSMVLDNDLARKREGCKATYKKVAGYHPLHAVWNGYYIDAIFRPGNHHSNHENQTVGMIEHLTSIIHEELGKDVMIVFRMDSGYFDQKIMECCENLGVKYLISAKDGNSGIWEGAQEIEPSCWKTYDNNKRKWLYCSYDFQLKSWDKLRKFYQLIPCFDKEETMQQLMSFGRVISLLVTNLDESDLLVIGKKSERDWRAELIFLHHDRGTDELAHRRIKEFGGESLPFEKYKNNLVWYYFRMLAQNSHLYFVENVLMRFDTGREYVSTTRRMLFQIAGHIVRTGNQIRLHINRRVGEAVKFIEIMELCRMPEYIIRP